MESDALAEPNVSVTSQSAAHDQELPQHLWPGQNYYVYWNQEVAELTSS
jgi:hypothetical protein